MNHVTKLVATFEAAHSYGTGRCKGVHGHSWTMTMYFESEPDDEEGRDHARDLLHALVRELDRRNINDQIPASRPNPQGIAAWAFERCDLLVEGLIQIGVEMEAGESASCGRD